MCFNCEYTYHFCVNKVATMMILNYLFKVSLIFHVENPRIDTLSFHYDRESWFTPAKTGLYIRYYTTARSDAAAAAHFCGLW